jgi:hypothetical protein
MRTPSSVPLVLGALLAGACGPISDTGSYCELDSDCSEVCNRLNECQAASDLISIRIHWTVGGTAPSPGNDEACGRIADFEVRMESDSLRDEPIAYYPVPCSLGQVYYDRMPDRLVSVQLSAVDDAQNILQDEIRILDRVDNELTIDFRP